MNWYTKAHYHSEALASKYRFNGAQVAGVVAALSPGNDWARNLHDTETLINDFKRGCRGADLPMVGSYGRANVLKSERILMGAEPLSVLGGLKVRAFYQCILNPFTTDAVCIDRHAKSVAHAKRVLDKEATVTAKQYEAISAAYRDVARQLGIGAHVLQAITWVAWRNRIAKGANV